MATTSLVDFAQFEQLAIPTGAHLELHHGEVVTLTTPKLKHRLIQRKLRRLIEEASPEAYVDTEVGFRPLPDHEYWEADVAYLTAERFRQADPEKNIEGSPDIVIEVLSPSNTAEEMLDREQTCLQSGSREFWIVYPRRHRIRVICNDSMKTYERDEKVFSMMNFSIKVDDVFRY
jgi:Uma2 family endonuclease